jgi:hypothetical protein
MCGKHDDRRVIYMIIVSAFVWSLITCWIEGLGTLMMAAAVDYDVLGMNVVIACAGALVNMMFTMAMFLDNVWRDCSAGLMVEEALYEMWV